MHDRLKINPFIWIFPIIVFYIFFSWIDTLNYWFFMGYEAFWLPGSKSDIFEFIPLYRSHAFIYFLNHRLFGWNASGWYFTGILIHIISTIVVIYSINKILSLFIKKYNLEICALFIGSIFGVSPFFHDVITWGSFNSYYGVILICTL